MTQTQSPWRAGNDGSNVPSCLSFQTGLCPQSKFDVHFGWTGQILDNVERKFMFRGFSKSILTWESQDNAWKLATYSDNNVIAILNETGIRYPFGTQNWFVFNDTCTIGANVKKTRLLSFSTCNENSFNCADGTW